MFDTTFAARGGACDCHGPASACSPYTSLTWLVLSDDVVVVVSAAAAAAIRTVEISKIRKEGGSRKDGCGKKKGRRRATFQSQISAGI